MKNKSIAVVIPAYNEARNIRAAVASVSWALFESGFFHEIIIVNDGSRDETEKISRELAARERGLRVISRRENRGMGYSILEGVRAAQSEYVSCFPGDDSVERESFKNHLLASNEAEIVLGVMTNVGHRPLFRRFLSRSYTFIMNILFGLEVEYYNGMFVYPTKLVQSIHVRSTGHSFFAELLIRAIKCGYSYTSVPFIHKVETEAASKAVSWRNVKDMVLTVFVLMRDIYIYKNPKGR